MLGSTNTGTGSVPTAGDNPSTGTGGGTVASVTATTPGVVNNADPANPVINVETATPQPVGAATVGTDNTLAIGNHSHAVLVAANAAAMVALTVTAMPDGTPIMVASRDAVFRLATSARTTNTWDTFASATAGRQWLREAHSSLKNAAVTAWGVNTTTGSDDAVGGVATPLRTVSELAYRLALANLGASVTATVVGSMIATDLPIFTFRCLPAVTFTIVGTPVVIYTSTIGVATAAAAGPGVGDNNFTDPAVPGGTFTAAGALAASVIGTRTNGTVAYFWFAKDKGATTARISKPSAALANGDTYNASTLPTFQVMRFAEQRYNACIVQLANIASGPWTDSSARFDRCWLTAASQLPAVAYANCGFAGGNGINQNASARGALFSVGGMFRGTGAQTFIIAGGVTASSIAASITFQGCALIIEGGTMTIPVDLYVNDYTGAAGTGAIAALYWGIIIWHTGALVGSGNTNFIFWAGWMSQIACAQNPALVAGSSPSATPIAAVGTPNFSVADMANGKGVINRGGNGVYYTNLAADNPLLSGTAVANGVVPVALGAVGPAGTSPTVVRWLDIPDGVGGTFRVASFL